jgi:hypothetical protein
MQVHKADTDQLQCRKLSSNNVSSHLTSCKGTAETERMNTGQMMHLAHKDHCSRRLGWEASEPTYSNSIGLRCW